MIPNQVKELFEKQSLVAFATSDKNGNPNAVPIFWKTIINDDTIKYEINSTNIPPIHALKRVIKTPNIIKYTAL